LSIFPMWRPQPMPPPPPDVAPAANGANNMVGGNAIPRGRGHDAAIGIPTVEPPRDAVEPDGNDDDDEVE
jgi:hypothetical protein